LCLIWRGKLGEFDGLIGPIEKDRTDENTNQPRNDKHTRGKPGAYHQGKNDALWIFGIIIDEIRGRESVGIEQRIERFELASNWGADFDGASIRGVKSKAIPKDVGAVARFEFSLYREIIEENKIGQPFFGFDHGSGFGGCALTYKEKA